MIHFISLHILYIATFTGFSVSTLYFSMMKNMNSILLINRYLDAELLYRSMFKLHGLKPWRINNDVIVNMGVYYDMAL